VLGQGGNMIMVTASGTAVVAEWMKEKLMA
jgi:uncharacterized protein YbjQ (UPF0145 family)